MVEKKSIERVINNITEPVIGLDEKMKVLFMNNIVMKISKLSAENVIGKPVQDIARRNDQISMLVKDLFDKELDFAKTNFISKVSHELKTPISSIKMSLNC